MKRPGISVGRPSRRTVLKIGAFGLGGLAVSALGVVGLCAVSRPGRHGEPPNAIGHLRSALLPTNAVHRIGRAYLDRFPAERDELLLVRLLESALEFDRMACPVTAMHALSTRSREDFREGYTVQVAGWVLGRTEARACAWASLGAGRPSGGIV